MGTKCGKHSYPKQDPVVLSSKRPQARAVAPAQWARSLIEAANQIKTHGFIAKTGKHKENHMQSLEPLRGPEVVQDHPDYQHMCVILSCDNPYIHCYVHETKYKNAVSTSRI